MDTDTHTQTQAQTQQLERKEKLMLHSTVPGQAVQGAGVFVRRVKLEGKHEVILDRPFEGKQENLVFTNQMYFRVREGFEDRKAGFRIIKGGK